MTDLDNLRAIRDNSRAIEKALKIYAVIALLEFLMLCVLPARDFPETDVRVVATLEETTYFFPDGRWLNVDRATWQVTCMKADRTFGIGKECY